MGLVLDWKASLGYRFDPFDPAVVRQNALQGLDDLKERFNLWLIKGGQLGTIVGEKGAGKTAFLRWIENELAPKRSHQQYYFDERATGSADDLRKSLGARHGMFSKFLSGAKDDKQLLAKMAKQQSVILIDNAGGLAKDALALLGTIIDKTPAHAVLTDTHERLDKLDLPVKDGLALKIGKYSATDLREILTAKIAGAGVANAHPFSDGELRTLIQQAQGNPATLLKLARERAIELSLKSGKGAQAAAPVAVSSGKKKLISIRLARPVEKGAQEEAPSAQATTPVHTNTDEDIAALSDIVERSPATEPTHRKESKPAPLSLSEADLLRELSGHSVKSPKKKAASKKPARKKR